MEEVLSSLIDELARKIANRVSEKINTPIKLKQFPENMDLNTAAEYVGLNSSYMRRNLVNLGIKYRRAGDKYLFRKCWLDEWMEDGLNRFKK